MKIFLGILFFFLAVNPVFAENPDINKIIKKMDDLYRSKSSYSKLQMTVITPNWQRTLLLDAWSEGMKKTFIRILSPEKERNMATLRIGNEMWNFLPNANKIIKIPPSMMMTSWMGSDFTNDDLVKESSMVEDYIYSYTKFENPEKDLLYVELKPKEDKPIVWARIVLAVRNSDYLPVWEKYYDEKGKLIRTMTFKDIKVFDGKKIPSVMELIPQNKPDQKTSVTYLNIKFDIALDENIFTLRNLRSRE